MTPANIATVMEEILHLDAVAEDDSFFDLGGNSLMASALISEIYLISHVELSMRDVVGAPAPALLSKVVISHSASASL